MLSGKKGTSRVSLPPNSTVTSVAQLLEKPLDYVPEVFGKINRTHRLDPPAVIRIGVSGEGKFPNYRIEHPAGIDGPFSGKNHKAIAPLSERTDAWSQATNSYEEIKSLLQQMRKVGA